MGEAHGSMEWLSSDPGRMKMPFGKHSGRTISQIAEEDETHLAWVIEQPGIREKRPVLVRAIEQLLATYAVEATPDHNAMQAKFLDEVWCKAFLLLVAGEAAWNWKVGRVTFEQGHDVFFDASDPATSLCESVAIELKPVVGDDYPAVLRQMRRSQHSGARRAQNVLIVRDFTSAVIGWDQLAKYFNTARIRCVRESEIEQQVARLGNRANRTVGGEKSDG